MIRNKDYSSITNVEEKWQNMRKSIEIYKKECLLNLSQRALLFTTLVASKVKRNDDETLKFLLGEVRTRDVINFANEHLNCLVDIEIDDELVSKKNFRVPVNCDLELCRTIIVDNFRACRYAKLIICSIDNYNGKGTRSPKMSYINREMDEFLFYLAENKDLKEEEISIVAKKYLEILLKKLFKACENIQKDLLEKVLYNDFTINSRSISIEFIDNLNSRLDKIMLAANNSDYESLKMLLEDEEIIDTLCRISDGYSKYCENIICILDDIYEMLYTFI